MSAALLLLIFAHFVGDFPLQSHWMAKNKATSADALLAHVSVYTGTLVIFIMGYLFIYPIENTGGAVILFGCIIFLSHLLTDMITSRITGVIFESAVKDLKSGLDNEFGRKYHDYFVVIGFDQFIHIASIWLALKILSIA